jgi:hypothetical protein
MSFNTFSKKERKSHFVRWNGKAPRKAKNSFLHFMKEVSRSTSQSENESMKSKTCIFLFGKPAKIHFCVLCLTNYVRTPTIF